MPQLTIFEALQRVPDLFLGGVAGLVPVRTVKWLGGEGELRTSSMRLISAGLEFCTAFWLCEESCLGFFKTEEERAIWVQYVSKGEEEREKERPSRQLLYARP